MASDREIEYRRLMKRWWRLEMSTRASCPLALVGKHDQHGPCVCFKNFYRLDHGRSWNLRRTSGLIPIYTAEPYGIETLWLAEFVPEMDRLGLRVNIEAASGYWPLRTVLLFVSRIEDRFESWPTFDDPRDKGMGRPVGWGYPPRVVME